MTENDSSGMEFDRLHLTILATSDVHARVLSYDYFADEPAESGSLARLATLIEQARKEAGAVLLVDNGDFLQGSPLGDVHVPLAPELNHPVIAAMNVLKYDAVALGNHEFDLKPADLGHVLGQAHMPLLCANLVPVGGAQNPYSGMWQDTMILPVPVTTADGREHSLKVGVFGVLPPQVVMWDRLRVGDKLAAMDMVVAAKAAVGKLKGQGADIVVAMVHSGISSETYVSGMENSAVHIAALEDVDVLVTGHTHKVFPGGDHPAHPEIDAVTGRLHGKPAVMPGAMGSHLGRIDLDLKRTATGWSVGAHQVTVLPALGAPEHPDILEAIAPAHARTLSSTREIVGDLKAPVQSYFAMIEDDRSVRLVAEAKLAHVKNGIAGTEFSDFPVLASVAPMKCGGRSGGRHYTDVAAGRIARRAVADMQYYQNHLSVLKLTGAQVLEWLEMSASLYRRLVPGRQRQVLFERDVPAYNREAIYGLSYEIDLTQPARYDDLGHMRDAGAHRVCGARFEGALLDPTQWFLLASNEYRVGGGGYYPGAYPQNQIPFPPVGVREILLEHLTHTGRGTSGNIPSWRFRPVADTIVEFETGVGALTHPLPKHVQIRGAATSDPDFVRFQLDLSGHSASE
ncbi:bifunctional 2',3'-cyclic-nucleotide 2'-phosphodiesterase/3'-nucleotidase [Shimia sp.]|uniref:bifunctional 2',3'-cyclic-nucleotide 2'-phosphodiesterase/3'-nucleotidase n=1 Tax=Shimia sp. TaxID=1954381 RepID=UPI00329948E9